MSYPQHEEKQQVLLNLLKSTEIPVESFREPDHAAAQDLERNPQAVPPGEEVLDFGDTLKIDNFQVVRREFFAHRLEPTVSFCDCKLTANSACLSKFPSAEYVQFLVDDQRKLLGLRPCDEGARDSFRWCNVSKGKRKPRDANGKIFFAKVVHLMGWNPNHKYTVLGRLAHANGEYLLLFDLSSFKTFERVFKDGEKPKTSRSAVFQADWKDSFGLPFREHEQMMKISVFDGFAVYSVTDPKPKKRKDSSARPMDGQTALIEAAPAGGDIIE